MRFGETIYGVMRHFVQPVLPSVLALFAPFIVAAPEPRDDAHFQDNASNHPPKSDADAAERTALEARVSVLLRDKLQAFGCIMRTSDLENDIPVLDPLKVKPKNITPAFGPDVFDVRFSNMKVTGSLYDLFRVAGAGEARIEYTDVFMRTVLYLDIIDNKLQLAFADQPYVDFSSAQVKVNGSNGPSSNRHFNDLSHQVAPIVFWVFAEDVASALEPHLEFYLNAQLARISLPPLAYALRDRVQPPKVRMPRPMPYNYVSSMYFYPLRLY
ncbi:uncharacterized protein LOC111243363 isoform X3 [Varroa destructor]|uniref:Uncharacterized protein n=1 Tax=Varroa destructor TaxID=109461 RepID=A0A7M7J0Y8_VARDE|nr:uncharacterized protein LOC111243363 isoform X3 [Varroa destructor]